MSALRLADMRFLPPPPPVPSWMPDPPWLFLSFLSRIGDFTRTGQFGDDRETAVAEHVERTAPAGDIDAALAAIDDFATSQHFLINIGDEKGKILDAAVESIHPRLVLELGTYVGYSALRIARVAPAAEVISIELSEANAAVAERIWRHAGVDDRVTCVVGSIGDGGATLDALTDDYAFDTGEVDFVFIDHDKRSYLADLTSIVDQGWLHPGSVVLADNVGIPGAPDYRTHMRRQQGRDWHTREHRTRFEYQSFLPDLVLESTYLGQSLP